MELRSALWWFLLFDSVMTGSIVVISVYSALS